MRARSNGARRRATARTPPSARWSPRCGRPRPRICSRSACSAAGGGIATAVHPRSTSAAPSWACSRPARRPRTTSTPIASSSSVGSPMLCSFSSSPPKADGQRDGADPPDPEAGTRNRARSSARSPLGSPTSPVTATADDFPGPPGHGAPRPTAPALVALGADDLAWLDRAIRLGRRGWGRVHPNPMVGCVLVRDGRVLAEGWHREFGGPHAEVDALEQVGGDAAGATAYVSLEPCRHEGKTPACTAALGRAQVARVVYAFADPDVLGGGGGADLRAAGLRVDGPIWGAAAAHRENPAFFHAARSHRPYVAVKLAVSLDGAIAAAPGERTPLTGPEASAAAHRLRAGFNGVLVGGETARVDGPRLTVRSGGVTPRVPPARMALDSRAALPSASPLFAEADGRAVVFVRDDADEAQLERLERAGAEVHALPGAPTGLDLAALLERAAGAGIHSILCEGGGRLVSSLIAQGLADRLYLFTVPRLLGPGAVPAFPGPFPERARQGWTPAFEPERLGSDVLVVYEPRDADVGPSRT
ncbi:MAG: bifunctional diaminohydroxyphosphoribosylaminopyrimidine deaminase/5-amino-6-(5-phosphoribosylamino)uracil reductase RibD [Gemmatimonadetes bacterium]|nr:bifunctional diaminohydroxyphosphoribosylaminopyrimidine deaminase/5-amino-6-(5-phosphoribosylamino)uracil reductase RibD [Gemmatimonadota bacterium]